MAEYVFLTEFVMTTITDWNKKTEKWDFEYEDGVKNSDIKLVEGTSELALNNVILYTKIDGVYHVSKPEPVEMTVAKKGIDYKNKTLTGTDETVYDWSEIAHKADNLYDDVSYAVQGVTYDLYQDHFGFTRLYKESDGGFALLTDGYYATDRRNDEYKAQIWNGEFTDVDVLDTADVEEIISKKVNLESDPRETIGGSTEDDEGTWKRLYRFNSTYYDGTAFTEHSWITPPETAIQAAVPANDHYKYNTNIASYVVDADGAYALSLARDHRENARTHYNSFAIDVTSETVKAKDQVLWGIEAIDANDKITATQRINTTTETVYYLVEGTGKNMKVTTWTGYNNAPSNYTVERAYAVTSYVADIDDWNNPLPYEVAEVVVIESTKASVPNAYLAINLEQRMFGQNQIGLNALGYHPDAEKWGLDTVTMKPSNNVSTLALQGSANWPDANDDMMNFYYVNEKGEAVRIESNYNYFGIYAGRVVTSPQVEHRNYIQITKDGSTTATQANSFFFPEDLDESYVVTYDRTTSSVRTKYDVDYTDDYDITNPDDAVDTYVQDGDGDRVIYMVDGDGNVGFVVNVTDSIYTKANGDKDIVPGLDDLWDQISGNAKKDTRIPIDITLNAENGETIEIEGVNATDNVEQTDRGILVNKTNLLQIKIKVTGGALGVIRFNDGWNEIIDQRSEADEEGWVTCTIYKLQTQSRVAPAAEENVIATVQYVVELIKEAKKTIGTGEGEITLEDAQAVLEELEMYNVPGVIVEENAEEIKDDDTTVSDAITTVGDNINTAETENNEAVDDSLQNLTDALEAWKGVIAGGALSDEYAAKEAIAKEYAEKIKAAADAEKIAELEREALIAMSDEITTTDAELEEELGKIAPLFCSGLTYKIDRGANKIYVTGGTVNPVVDKNTDDVELLEAMMRWYWDKSENGDGKFEVVKNENDEVTGYKLTYLNAETNTQDIITKTAAEIINAVVKQDTGYAFLTIDCRSIVDMENDQAWLLSRL